MAEQPQGATPGWEMQPRAQRQQTGAAYPPRPHAAYLPPAAMQQPQHLPQGTIPNPTAVLRPGMMPATSDASPKRRWPKVVVTVAAALMLLALGSCVGGAGQQQEVEQLESELSSTSAQLSGAVAERDELAALVDQQVTELEDAQAEISEVSATLVTAQDDLSTAAAELAAAQALVAERDETIASLQSQLASAQAATTPAIAPLAAAPAAAPAAPSASVYYANCAAVRAAGAAPIRVGQPGYGRHLDRDGDGVGCE